MNSLAQKLFQIILIIALPLAVLAGSLGLPSEAMAAVQADCTDAGSDGITDNKIIVATKISESNCYTDGVDDQEEIQWALDNSVSGYTVHLKAGTYIIAAKVWINTANIIFEGDGDTSIFKYVDNATAAVFPQTKSWYLYINNNNVTIQNLKFHGNTVNQTLLASASYLEGLHFTNIHSGIIIQNNTFQEFHCDAVDGSAEGIIIQNNHFIDVRHDGITGSFSNSIIQNNTFTVDTQSMNAAIRLYNGGNNIYRNNNIFDPYPTSGKVIPIGFEIQPAGNNNGSGNIFENNIMNGLYNTGFWFTTSNTNLATVQNTIIRNNILNGTNINGPGLYGMGIKLEGLWNNMTIENNVINKTFNNAISEYTTTGGNIIIKNNIIANSKRYGINSSSSNFILSYNNVWNNTLGNYNGISAGLGDISLDPLFADPANGDFHLKSQAGRWNGTTWVTDTVTSSAIGAGDPTTVIANCPSWGCPSRIEMGAYGNTAEASQNFISPTPVPSITPTPSLTPTSTLTLTPTLIPSIIPSPSLTPTSTPTPAPKFSADLNSDGSVNAQDFAILMSAWNSIAKPKADINQDGLVDSLDFGLMMSFWG